MSDLKISVIIPVYNTGKFLSECVLSIVRWDKADDKSGKSFPGEILLVDNGSTDNSLEVAKKLAEKFSFVKTLVCKTPGAAAAKNYGLKRAKGDWVWFIDSDDFVMPGAVRKVFDRIKKTPEVDAVVMGMDRVDEDGKTLNRPLSSIRTTLDDANISQKEWISKFVRYGLGPVQVPARREFLVQNKLFFDEGMIHEDMAIMSSYVLYTNKIASISDSIYMYRQRKGSVLHSPVWSKKELDIFKALELLSKRFEKTGRYEEFKPELEYFYIWNLLDDAAHEFKKFKEGRREFKTIRKTIKSRFPKWRHNKYFRGCPLMVRLRCEAAFFGIVR